MGNDQLYKRKSKGEDKKKRKKGNKSLVLNVLIVTEGTETERSYFEPYFKKLNLPNVDCVVRDDCDSAPICVVNKAKLIINETDNKYDLIFCVFDRDSHTTYEEAKSKCSQLSKDFFKNNNLYNYYKIEEYGEDFINFIKNQHRFVAITSNPCVEYWFYLHGEYSRFPVEASGQKSSGDKMIELLKDLPVFENYDKKLTTEQFNYLYANTNIAKGNAKQAIKDIDKVGNENPHTKIHEMLDLIERVSELPKTNA